YEEESYEDFLREMRRASPGPIIMPPASGSHIAEQYPAVAAWVQGYGHIDWRPGGLRLRGPGAGLCCCSRMTRPGRLVLGRVWGTRAKTANRWHGSNEGNTGAAEPSA